MTRAIVRETLQKHLTSCPPVLAMWEAGSAAFGRADDYSDLDVGILAREGTNDDVWNAVDAAFEELGGVILRWNEPNPLFKGMEKRIFRPRLAERWLQVDVGVFPDSADELYNQPERHGAIQVVFDRVSRLSPPLWDERAHHQKMCEALHQAVMKWRTYHGWFRKELARGRAVDAFVWHFGMTISPLLNVLGMRYRPKRWDFGFRYLKEELPAEVVSVVERLCYVSSPAELEARFTEADQLFSKTLKKLEEKGIVPVDPKGLDIVPPPSVILQ